MAKTCDKLFAPDEEDENAQTA